MLSRMYYNGDIVIIGAVYDLESGKVEFLEETLTDLPASKFSKRDIMGL
ncbi:hypothetical protein A3SI_04337 [Nitritalea halalkaliphila LW7]|uniref:Carbonic anhydrase n=1 Tax=Nitritalea halalkaliphila LW7 TaxID=1189621 RepID=I5C878_9BACT|nr:hypothetical protein A3SI_04337 [Nitritalea halalkaliphila LW7]